MKNYLIFAVLPILCITVTSLNDGAEKDDCRSMKEFQKLGRNYYLIESNVKKTWLSAAHFCRSKDTHLASIETEDEWKALNSYLVSNNFTTDIWFWLADNDIEEPLKFYSISSGKLMNFTKWSEGQPDNTKDKERCVHLWRQGDEFLMNDLECEDQLNFICKAVPKKVTITIW